MRWPWKTRKNSTVAKSTRPRYRDSILQHDEAKEKEMRAALGDEGFRRWDQARELADLDRSGVQLSTDESDKLYDLRKNLDRKQLELDKARLQGKLTDEDAASQSSALYTKYNQDLLKFLGDDRYAQMQNGGDTGMSELKQNLNGINADDSQMSGMQTAQQQWNSQRNQLDIQLQEGEVTAEDYQKQLAALDTQRDQEYQKVLGTNGFAAFQRNQSEQYQALKRLGPGLGFSGDDVNNLYAHAPGLSKRGERLPGPRAAAPGAGANDRLDGGGQGAGKLRAAN